MEEKVELSAPGFGAHVKAHFSTNDDHSLFQNRYILIRVIMVALQ